jgi:hypothetical protein
MVRFSDFDLDFRDGKEGEDYVEDVVKQIISGTIEVKRDIKWLQTGNIYVETECFFQTTQSWELSGLSVTKATHWAFVLGEMVIILPTEDLKTVVEVDGHAIQTDIEPNPTKGYLIKIEHIINKNRYGVIKDENK